MRISALFEVRVDDELQQAGKGAISVCVSQIDDFPATKGINLCISNCVSIVPGCSNSDGDLEGSISLINVTNGEESDGCDSASILELKCQYMR
jgi:hypothetical protein